MAGSDSGESELSSQSTLSGPPSDNEMDVGEVKVKGRQRRVIADDDDDGSVEEENNELGEDEDAEGEDDDEEEDDELLDEDAEGSDVDELEDDEDEPATASTPGNARGSGSRKITLRITPSKKGGASTQGGSSKAGARTSRNKSKKSRGRTSAGETLDDDDGSFDEFENEDMFASLPKTARQLAKEKAEQGIDSPGSELLELPPEESKRQRMTESELALKRSELARRRRNQTEKKLEDDKIETINRLLKKQVSRTGGRAKRGADKDESDGDDDADDKEGGNAAAAEHMPTPQELKERPAPFFRYVQSIRDGVLVRSSLSLPIETVTTSAGETAPADGPYKRKWDEMFGGQQKDATVAATGQ